MSKTVLHISGLLSPQIHPSAWIAPGAHVIGNVILKENASVWYNAVLRGDINQIVIGQHSNVQDGCIFHVENERACIVGDYVTVGHGAILHGCTIEDGALIGMGAIILNGAVIQKGAMVAAGALIKEGMMVPAYSLAAGVPAKILKTLPDTTFQTHIEWAQKYVGLKNIHRNETP